MDECGGTLGKFSDAYDAAMTTIVKENKMIGSHRISKGKIVEPIDNKDICPVCGMYSAKYPKNKCQIQKADEEVIHFCSTQCLFDFIKSPNNYNVPKLKSKFIWVVDFDNGQWIFSECLYESFDILNSCGRVDISRGAHRCKTKVEAAMDVIGNLCGRSIGQHIEAAAFSE